MTDSPTDCLRQLGEGRILDSGQLKPRMALWHSSGSVVVLSRRKEDGSGWWNTDGSGLVDRIAESGEWSVVPSRAHWSTLCDVVDAAEELRRHGYGYPLTVQSNDRKRALETALDTLAQLGEGA